MTSRCWACLEETITCIMMIRMHSLLPMMARRTTISFSVCVEDFMKHGAEPPKAWHRVKMLGNLGLLDKMERKFRFDC